MHIFVFNFFLIENVPAVFQYLYFNDILYEQLFHCHEYNQVTYRMCCTIREINIQKKACLLIWRGKSSNADPKNLS